MSNKILNGWWVFMRIVTCTRVGKRWHSIQGVCLWESERKERGGGRGGEGDGAEWHKERVTERGSNGRRE